MMTANAVIINCYYLLQFKISSMSDNSPSRSDVLLIILFSNMVSSFLESFARFLRYVLISLLLILYVIKLRLIVNIISVGNTIANSMNGTDDIGYVVHIITDTIDATIIIMFDIIFHR